MKYFPVFPPSGHVPKAHMFKIAPGNFSPALGTIIFIDNLAAYMLYAGINSVCLREVVNGIHARLKRWILHKLIQVVDLYDIIKIRWDGCPVKIMW